MKMRTTIEYEAKHFQLFRKHINSFYSEVDEFDAADGFVFDTSANRNMGMDDDRCECREDGRSIHVDVDGQHVCTGCGLVVVFD